VLLHTSESLFEAIVPWLSSLALLIMMQDFRRAESCSAGAPRRYRESWLVLAHSWSSVSTAGTSGSMGIVMLALYAAARR